MLKKKGFEYSLLLIGCLLATVGQKAQAVPSSKDAQRYQEAYNYILEEKWEEAVEACKALVQEFKDSSYVDDASFWHCYAMEKKGAEYEDVFRCYEDFIKAHPKSKWADDAKRNLIVIGKKLSDMGKKEYEAIVRAMQDSEDKEIALTAISALKNIGGERALDALVDLYKRTQHRAVREEIIFALSEFRSPKAVQSLTEIVKEDPDRHMREKAIFWLGQKAQSEEMIRLLEHVALNDPNQEVREKALFGLSQAHDGTGVKALIRIIETAKDVATRKKAVFWIGQKATSEESIRCLETVVQKDSVPEIRKDAILALSQTRDGRGVEALKRIAGTAKDVTIRKEAVFWIGQKAGTLDVVKFLETVVQKDPAMEVRESALHALAQAPQDKGESALINLAKSHPDKAIRKKAVFWVGQKATSEQSISCLETVAQKDSVPEIRKDAILALSQTRDARGVEALKRIAGTAKDVATRKEAVFWIGQKAGSGNVIRFLETVVRKDSTPEVRKQALDALVHARKNLGVPALINLAKSHPDKTIRKEAVFWIGQKATTDDVIRFLETIVRKDSDPEVRKRALDALIHARQNLGVLALINLAKSHPDKTIRKEAVFWVGQKATSEQSIGCLETVVYKDPDPEVRKRALDALVHAPNNLGVPALINIAKSHPDKTIRREAVFWLGESKDPRAIEALLEIVKELK